jgi:manganese transport protein
MVLQALSAKLGIVTGRNFAELSREQFPRALVWAMWVVSEIGAMATDLAEFLGGALGLSLLSACRCLSEWRSPASRPMPF